MCISDHINTFLGQPTVLVIIYTAAVYWLGIIVGRGPSHPKKD